MRWILLFPAIYLAAVLETSLADFVRVGTVGPDFLVLVAILWTILYGGPRAFLVAGAIGLVGDLLVPGHPGPGMALLLVIGFAIGRTRGRLPLEYPACQLALLAAASTAFAAGLAVITRLLGETSQPLSVLFQRSIGVGLYTAAFALPCVLVIHWMRRPLRLDRRRMAGMAI